MAKITGKEWYFSKTIWLAVLQGVVGVLVAIMAANPEVKVAGVIGILKSVIDIINRFNTSTTLKL